MAFGTISDPLVAAALWTASVALAATGVLLLVIVVIRILLSFSLEVEIDGAWPWRRSQIGSRAEPERTERP